MIDSLATNLKVVVHIIGVLMRETRGTPNKINIKAGHKTN